MGMKRQKNVRKSEERGEQRSDGNSNEKNVNAKDEY